MTPEQDIETVKRLYEAFRAGDIPALLDQCTNDVDWATDSEIEVARGTGPSTARPELPAFFEAIGQSGTVTEFTPLSFASNDDGDVMVFLRYGVTLNATGEELATNLHHYWRFRDGKVAYYRGSEDTALSAAALSP